MTGPDTAGIDVRDFLVDDGAHPEKGRTTVKRALKVRFTVQVTPKWIRASLGTRNMCLAKWTTTNRLCFVSLLRLSLPAWLPPCQHITSSLTNHQLDILRDKSPAYTDRTGIFSFLRDLVTRRLALTCPSSLSFIYQLRLKTHLPKPPLISSTPHAKPTKNVVETGQEVEAIVRQFQPTHPRHGHLTFDHTYPSKP